MRRISSLLMLVLLAGSMSAVTFDAEAKRLGGGSSVGRQRPTPTVVPRKATPDTPPASQNTPAQAAPAAATPPAAAAPQPGFLGRFGPMLAGLGIGALLGSMLGGAGGSGLLMLLLAGVAVWLLMRSLAARRGNVPAGAGAAGMGAPYAAPEPVPAGMPAGTQYQGSAEAAGGGSGAPLRTSGVRFADEAGGPTAGPVAADAAAAPGALPFAPDSAEAKALMRIAESAFIRLQAANDAGDLNDLRSAATPEVFAELAMQIRERGSAPQQTEVVRLAAQPVEMITEDEYLFMSVRYTGLIREAAGAEPQPFDEIWHLRRKSADADAAWLISGIQQLG